MPSPFAAPVDISIPQLAVDLRLSRLPIAVETPNPTATVRPKASGHTTESEAKPE